MEILIQTPFPGNRRPTIVDMEDFSSAEELGSFLYIRSLTDGMIYMPVSATIPGLEEPVEIDKWGLETIFSIHEISEEHGSTFGRFLNLGIHDSDPNHWGNQYVESFRGSWGSKEEWAREFISDCSSELAEMLDTTGTSHLFDYEQYADESDFEFVRNGWVEVHVFDTSI